MPHLAIILLLTGLVHCLDTASYASRIAGTRTGRLALTGAMFNIVSLVSRVAYTLQAPLLGSAIDRMVRHGNLGGLLGDFHLIIVAASVGTLAGTLLIPTFAALFGRAANSYETHGSFATLLLHTLSLRGFSGECPARQPLQPAALILRLNGARDGGVHGGRARHDVRQRPRP
jgi:hypothetical protein